MSSAIIEIEEINELLNVNIEDVATPPPPPPPPPSSSPPSPFPFMQSAPVNEMMKNKKETVFLSEYRRFLDVREIKARLGKVYNVSLDHDFLLGDIVYGHKKVLDLYNSFDTASPSCRPITYFPNGYYYGMVIDVVSTEMKKKAQSLQNTFLVVFMFDYLGEQSCFPFLKSQRCKRIVEGYLSHRVMLLRFDEVIGVCTDVWIPVKDRPDKFTIKFLHLYADNVNDNDLRGDVFIYTYCIAPDMFSMSSTSYLGGSLRYLLPAPTVEQYMNILRFDVFDSDDAFILNIKRIFYDKHVVKNVRRSRHTVNLCKATWKRIYEFAVWVMSMVLKDKARAFAELHSDKGLNHIAFTEFMKVDSVITGEYINLIAYIEHMKEFDITKLVYLLEVLMNLLYAMYHHKFPVEVYYLWLERVKHSSYKNMCEFIPEYFYECVSVDRILKDSCMVALPSSVSIMGKEYHMGGDNVYVRGVEVETGEEVHKEEEEEEEGGEEDDEEEGEEEEGEGGEEEEEDEKEDEDEGDDDLGSFIVDDDEEEEEEGGEEEEEEDVEEEGEEEEEEEEESGKADVEKEGDKCEGVDDSSFDTSEEDDTVISIQDDEDDVRYFNGNDKEEEEEEEEDEEEEGENIAPPQKKKKYNHSIF